MAFGSVLSFSPAGRKGVFWTTGFCGRIAVNWISDIEMSSSTAPSGWKRAVIDSSVFEIGDPEIFRTRDAHEAADGARRP